MFGALRQNSLLYILDKNNKPELKTATVISVSSPQYYNSASSYINVTVNIDGNNMEFKELPFNMSTTYSKTDPNILVSEDREAVCNELQGIKNQAQDRIDNHELDKEIVEVCDNLLSKIDPKIAKEKEQEQRINLLDTRMGKLEDGINDIKTMMSAMLNK